MNVVRHPFYNLKAWKLGWGLLISVACSELGNGNMQHGLEAGGQGTGIIQVATTDKLSVIFYLNTSRARSLVCLIYRD